MKKSERREYYIEIQNLMLAGKNKEAFTKLCLMGGADVGIFCFVDYDKFMAKLAAK